MIDLTFARTVELLREAIEERGENYVYKSPTQGSSCLYVHHNGQGGSTAGCIVGWVLHKAGVPLEALTRCENHPAVAVLEALESEGEGLRYEREAGVLLRRVQQWQDAGEPWGTAFSNGYSGRIHPDWQ